MSADLLPPGPPPELCTLGDKLRFLQSPGALEGGGPDTELIETHVSWIVLSARHALKLKKPVRSPWFDFTTLQARQRNALEELRLNRRLAPDIYLDVLALVLEGERLRLVPQGLVDPQARVVDWVVWMKRLPAQRMLDRMIRDHTLSRDDVETLSDVLHGFYRRASVSVLREQDYLERFAREDRLNREVLLLPRFALRGADEVLAGYTTAMAAAQPVLRDRVRHYRLVDGHGDLRPEHVCLLPTPVVIDALEFSTELRQVDPLDELIFLSMECALLGAPWIEPVLLQRWTRFNGDAVPGGLPERYRASRALLRARQCAAHLLDDRPRTPDRWLPRAQAYLDAAGETLRGALSAPGGAAPRRVAAPDRPGP